MKKIKIDVIAIPLSGHLYPLMDLVAPLLTDDRFELRLFTGPQKTELARQRGFDVITFLPDDAAQIDRVANNNHQHTLRSAYRQIADSMDLINRVSDFLLAEWQHHRPDIVVADFISLSGGLVCQQLGIPWITSMATQFAIETTDGPPCFFGGWTNEPRFWIQWRNKCGRSITKMIKRIVVFFLRKKVARYHFSLYNEKEHETVYSPYSILSLGMKELELKSGFPEHFVWAGPCCNSFENSLPDWKVLHHSTKKKVLISCGTQLPWGKEQLIVIGKDLGVHYPDYHFIVTLGSGDKMNEPPVSVSENVTVMQYVPYSHYFPQMDYIIHHGGAGVFYNCIRYAKPALILPHDYDQADYAARGVAAGVAYSANRNDLAAIRQQFGQLIRQKNWPALDRLATIYQHYRPTETLISEVYRILKEV